MYCVRIKGTEFTPKVFEAGKYKIIIRDTESGLEKVYEHVEAVEKKGLKSVNIKVSF